VNLDKYLILKHYRRKIFLTQYDYAVITDGLDRCKFPARHRHHAAELPELGIKQQNG
jgi:hypothetical protein